MDRYQQDGTSGILNFPPTARGRLALWLHVVVHELATKARKYGALRSKDWTVSLTWEIQQALGAAGKLAPLSAARMAVRR